MNMFFPLIVTPVSQSNFFESNSNPTPPELTRKCPIAIRGYVINGRYAAYTVKKAKDLFILFFAHAIPLWISGSNRISAMATPYTAYMTTNLKTSQAMQVLENNKKIKIQKKNKNKIKKNKKKNKKNKKKSQEKKNKSHTHTQKSQEKNNKKNNKKILLYLVVVSSSIFLFFSWASPVLSKFIHISPGSVPYDIMSLMNGFPVEFPVEVLISFI